MTTWHKYPDIKPSPSAKYSDFLVAYPNPHLFTSKFANVHFNDGRPRFVYDIANWTGTQFAMTDSKVRYWSPIPSPDNTSQTHPKTAKQMTEQSSWVKSFIAPAHKCAQKIK